MKMSREEKHRSHARIVASAARLMRQHGVEGASVNDVMTHAGLTHGGFYKHFGSKDDLLAAALDRAFDDIAEMIGPDPTPAEAPARLAAFQAFYLSDAHVATPAAGCPIAALGNDVARAATALKTQFGAGVRRVIALLARGAAGSARTQQLRATRKLAMMAGAVMIARASDPDTARAVLAACRD
jgi:TetR/AcrR family transcriptional repressor of nem operon